MQQKLGFVGLGMMGLPMAKRLLKASSQLSVYNRTKQKAEGLLTEGAQWCQTPSAGASQSDIIFSMVSNPDVLTDVALGPVGILSGLKPGGIHIDMSTVSPAVPRELAQRYSERGCVFIHAPVLGSIPQATDGTLLMFAGGDAGAYSAAELLLKVLAKQIWKFDRPEQAAHLKLLCNLFIAGMIVTLGHALVFAQKVDVDPRVLLGVISQSQLNSPMYQTKGVSILDANFAPRFHLEHMLKDVNLMLDAARPIDAPLPAIRVAQHLLAEAQSAGFGQEDYSAVFKVLQMMGNK